MKRRDFVKASAILPLFSIVPRHVLGRGFLAPSDKITMGFIGNGRQSGGLQRQFLGTKEAVLVATSDVDSLKLNKFIADHEANAKKLLEQDVKGQMQGYADFRELLDRKDIDSVVIATPDHWHAVIAVMALDKGKDVYCEKPLSLTVAEGRAMVDATRRNKRVFQTGSMQRSGENFRKACELVRNGYIGEIKEILVTVGSPPKPVDFQPEPIPANLNWEMWLGPNPEHFYHHFLAPRIEDTFWGKWRDYQGFGGGGMTDWGAHMFDIAQWGLGMDATGPTEITPPAGPLDFTKPIFGLQYKYANGIVMKHEDFKRGNAVRFIGTEGQIDISRGFFDVPEKLKGITLKESDVKLQAPENHYKDFLNAIRSRQKPICDVEIGHRSCTVCNIGNIAYLTGEALKWNPTKEEFAGNKKANAMLSRKLKKPFNVV